MTDDEYRAALNRLTPENLATFRERWGGAKGTTLDESVKEFVYATADKRLQYERTIIFHLRALGITDLKTEDEKILDVARDSAQAAKDSAIAAKDSAGTASRSVWWAIASAAISTLSLIVAILALLANVAIESCRLRGGPQ